MFAEGALLLERVLAEVSSDTGPPRRPTKVLTRRDHGRRATPTARSRRGWPSSQSRDAHATVLDAHPLRELLTVEGPYPAYVDRERALFGSWYEFFPRSEGATRDATTGKVISGTFRTAAKRLEAVAAMGFDVIYLPPIHPIGEVNRKGPNNTLTPGPTTPGRPGRSAARTAGTTRSTPTSAPSTTSTRSWRGPASSGSRWRSTSRCRRRRTTRG